MRQLVESRGREDVYRRRFVLRPGAASRLGEAAALRPALLENMNEIIDLITDGYVDGGDILCTDDRVLLGLSARTNGQGAEELRSIVGS